MKSKSPYTEAEIERSQARLASILGIEEDDLAIPDFLDRKKNPQPPTTPEEMRVAKASKREPKIVWPKKRNWRKIEERRRRLEKAEGAALLAGSIIQRRGQ